MKKIVALILSLVVVLVLSISALAANVGFETLTVNGSTAITSSLLTKAGYGPAIFALLGPVETDQVRFRTDGTAPTASVGHLLQVGDSLRLNDYSEIVNFHAIKVTNNASVPVTLIYGPKQ